MRHSIRPVVLVLKTNKENIGNVSKVPQGRGKVFEKPLNCSKVETKSENICKNLVQRLSWKNNRYLTVVAVKSNCN